MSVHFSHPIKELRLKGRQRRAARVPPAEAAPPNLRAKTFYLVFSSLAISRVHEYYLVLAAASSGSDSSEFWVDCFVSRSRNSRNHDGLRSFAPYLPGGAQDSGAFLIAWLRGGFDRVVLPRPLRG